MEYVYAVLILHELKKEINEEFIKAILNAVNVPINESTITVLVESLDNVNISEIFKSVAIPIEKKEIPKKVEEVKVKEEPEEEMGLTKLFGS